MTQITSYETADEVFGTARVPLKGKPLGPRGIRLFKVNGDFVVTCGSIPVALIGPNNLLRILRAQPPQGFIISCRKVLPLWIERAGTNHYRVHIRTKGAPPDSLSSYGISHWRDLRSVKHGARFHEGLTIDLTTRQVVGAGEVTTEVDPDARKVWLRQLKHLKQVLKTMAKLGVFTSRLETISPTMRGYIKPFQLKEDGQLFAADLRSGKVSEASAKRLTDLLRRDYYRIPTVADQCKFIDKFFSKHSTTLRAELGVIK